MLVRHCRFADFFNNLIMLLVAVPFILSRERNIKASAGLTVLMVGVVYVVVYFARYVGLAPVIAAWLPVLLFGPLATFMLDAVKT
jgi:lipopolysaccharide export system permease protein